MAKKKSDCNWNCQSNSCSGIIYFLGWLGAAIYYVQIATGFWASVWAIIKALAWPAILVYNLLGM